MHLSSVRQETKAGSLVQEALPSPVVDVQRFTQPPQVMELQVEAKH